MADTPIDRAVNHTLQPKITLVIVATPDGQITVNGPIGNKPICYKLLIDAAVAVANYQGEAPRIAVPGLIPPPNLRN